MEADLKRVEKFLQESILIAFDFIWKGLLSHRNLKLRFKSLGNKKI